MRRGRLQRLLRIIERARCGAYPNCSSLAAELGVTPRTIHRDLDLLRDDWHAPLEFDHTRNGYWLTDPDWEPAIKPDEPSWSLSAGEAVALVLSLHAFDALRGHGLEGAFRSLLAKLPDILPEEVSVDMADLARQISYFFGPLRGDAVQVSEFLARLREALEARRVVEMTYYTASRDEETVRLVEPYHLRYHEGVWYLVGWCRWRQAVRTFAVDRIRRLEVRDETFPPPPPERFSPDTYFGEAWRLQRGAEKVRVLARFEPEQARYLRGRLWHPSQEAHEEPDGALVLSFRVLGIEEIARWLLQFGSRVEVLEPPALRALLAEEARRLEAVYAYDPQCVRSGKDPMGGPGSM